MKTDYILRSLSKTTHKRWEHYVINRIYHRLNDAEIEFVCQQCIRKPHGNIALADLFFPQLGIYLEIDEGHHEVEANRIADAQRRFDIAEVTNFVEYRIKTTGIDLESLDKEIEEFITRIQSQKKTTKDFRAWDYENRFTAAYHLQRGFIEIGPDAAFWHHRDALQCFGYKGGHYQRAVWNIPSDQSLVNGIAGKSVIWFPKLYTDANWENSLSEDGTLIIEKNKDANHSYDEPWDSRVVMAKSRDELNRVLYRFVGVFRVIKGYDSGSEHHFERIATRVDLRGLPS